MKTSGGRGITPEEAIKKGEQMLSLLENEYPVWLEEDLRSLEELITLYSKKESNKADIRKKINIRIHDVRSQGTTFKLPLITGVAHSFCRLLEETQEDALLPAELFFLHLNSLRLVLEKKFDGNAGDAEKTLLKSLDKMVDTFLQKPEKIRI